MRKQQPNCAKSTYVIDIQYIILLENTFPPSLLLAFARASGGDTSHGAKLLLKLKISKDKNPITKLHP
jgi:hypothetical protein